MTRVHLANNILVHIIKLLFKSHPVYRQLKKVSKNTYALINMVRHFPILYFQVVHFQSPQDDDGENEDDDGDDDIAMTIVMSASPAVSPCRTNKTCRECAVCTLKRVHVNYRVNIHQANSQ